MVGRGVARGRDVEDSQVVSLFWEGSARSSGARGLTQEKAADRMCVDVVDMGLVVVECDGGGCDTHGNCCADYCCGDPNGSGRDNDGNS